jgi:hypothetical protein
VTGSAETFQAAAALFEAALVESKVERYLSEARVAKLKAAAALEQSGRHEEAAALIAAVRAEQEASR